MILYLSTFGSHSNQLWEFLLIDCLARQCKTKPVFFEIKKLFKFYPQLSKKYKSFSTLVVYPIVQFILLVLRKFKIVKSLSLENLPGCIRFANSHNFKKMALFHSWDYRVNKILLKGEDPFLINHDYYEKLFSTDISSVKNKYISNKTNVAIHVRRGDYAQYEGGRFFYSDDVYVQKVSELCKIFNLKDIRLIICSNDCNLELSKYISKFPDTVLSNENFTTDHQIMAACDYIIGPPSSFSMWASYLGQTPCMHIYKPEEKLKKEDFYIFNSYKTPAFKD